MTVVAAGHAIEQGRVLGPRMAGGHYNQQYYARCSCDWVEVCVTAEQSNLAADRHERWAQASQGTPSVQEPSEARP